MNLMFFELVDIGFFQCFFAPENPWLMIPMWLCLLLGAGIEALLLKKGCPWQFPLILLMAGIGGEILCQCITGWDLITAFVLYGLILVLLTGAVLALILGVLIGKIRGGSL